MVFQHFSLFEAMTVLENVALGVDGVTDMKALAARVREVSHAYGLPLDPEREVHTLSVGERQRIEIVRCLLQNPRLLIMDEPTSVLTPQEVDRLFETLRQLAAEGCSILYISHKLQRSKPCATAPPSCAAARSSATATPRPRPRASMAQLMIGAELRTLARREGARAGRSRASTVAGLSLRVRPSRIGIDLKRIGFEVRAGEIFGIAGVAGNGQNELMLALSRRAHGRARHRDPHRRQAGRPSRRRRSGAPGPVLRAGGAQRPCRGAAR